MNRLVIATLIWAFSFSLIGNYISGKMDIYVAILIRILLGLIVFLPFLKINQIKTKESVSILSTGALQIGLMYVFYFNSFAFLSVAEVALFTIFTPLYVSLLGQFFQGEFASLRSWMSVLLALIGALVIKWNGVTSDFLVGFLLVQCANLSFALGQTLFKKNIKKDLAKSYFSLFFIGALVPVIPLVVFKSNIEIAAFGKEQVVSLLWLGFIASGFGYYLWNTGSKVVSYTSLAVMNNVVIPAAIFVNFIFWGNSDLFRVNFLLGTMVILIALYINKKKNTLHIK